MDAKLTVNLAAALVPLAVGAVWYHPMVTGNIMMRAHGLTEIPKKSGARMALALVLTYVGAFLMCSRILSHIVIHQHGLYGMLANQPDVHTQGTELYNTVQGLMDKYGTNFRTFKHGALHGFYTGLYLVAPVLGIITLFESRPWVWFLIHALYWIACLTIMGGILCAYLP